MTVLLKVISGGQTGADIGGVIAAKRAGLETGGMMPATYRTLKGPRPEYASLYGMGEHYSYAYPPRTEYNVNNSDGTIRFATDWFSPGERCTRNMIEKHSKPYMDVTAADDWVYPATPATAVEWILSHKIRVLNIAGNSELTSPGIQKFVEQFMEEVFRGLGIS